MLLIEMDGWRTAEPRTGNASSCTEVPQAAIAASLGASFASRDTLIHDPFAAFRTFRVDFCKARSNARAKPIWPGPGGNVLSRTQFAVLAVVSTGVMVVVGEWGMDHRCAIKWAIGWVIGAVLKVVKLGG
jgi:hypothetical protein